MDDQENFTPLFLLPARGIRTIYILHTVSQSSLLIFAQLLFTLVMHLAYVLASCA